MNLLRNISLAAAIAVAATSIYAAPERANYIRIRVDGSHKNQKYGTVWGSADGHLLRAFVHRDIIGYTSFGSFDWYGAPPSELKVMWINPDLVGMEASVDFDKIPDAPSNHQGLELELELDQVRISAVVPDTSLVRNALYKFVIPCFSATGICRPAPVRKTLMVIPAHEVPTPSPRAYNPWKVEPATPASHGSSAAASAAASAASAPDAAENQPVQPLEAVQVQPPATESSGPQSPR